jgi:hypothetical protein
MTFEKFLDTVIDDIFDANYSNPTTDGNWWRLSKASGVSYGSVVNLGNRDTKSPHLKTVYRLAEAVGIDVRLIKQKVKLYKGEAA